MEISILTSRVKDRYLNFNRLVNLSKFILETRYNLLRLEGNIVLADSLSFTTKVSNFLALFNL